jgi:membrane glycosyltransferase
MRKPFLSVQRGYFILLFILWLMATLGICSTITLALSHHGIAGLWVAGFSFLIFNVLYMFLTSVFYLAAKHRVLPESYVPYIPKTAIVYPLKNESAAVLERIAYTFANNRLPDVDLWVLSDSDPGYLAGEEQMVMELKKRFGEHKIRYRHRPVPFERKQGNILSWLTEHPYYKYFFVCDADSMAPRGTLLKLIKKAEHPENADVALFQSFINITHAKTHYAKIQAIGARLAQELFFKTYQNLFGRQISFGHLCLIRACDFIRIRIPKGILSHDIWDTAALDQLGKRIVFCPDVVTWDEAPPNFVEARKRDKRWARGTLQSWPLLFKRGLTPATRFFVFYGIYVYLAHPVLLGWLILNAFLVNHRFSHLLIFKPNNNFVFSPYMSRELLAGLLLTIAVIYGHKFVTLRCFKAKEIVREIVFSTLLSLNNIFYQTIDILCLPFEGLSWKPTKKDPFTRLSLLQTAKGFWPTTLLGLMGLSYGLYLFNSWTILSLPLLLSFALSIPVVYWTAQTANSKVTL